MRPDPDLVAHDIEAIRGALKTLAVDAGTVGVGLSAQRRMDIAVVVAQINKLLDSL